jgi:hypothetical protein
MMPLDYIGTLLTSAFLGGEGSTPSYMAAFFDRLAASNIRSRHPGQAKKREPTRRTKGRTGARKRIADRAAWNAGRR